MNATDIFNNSDLSVGKISAIVAAAVFILQFILPTLVPIIALGVLQENGEVIEASASTWSKLAVILHSSYWPSILTFNSTSSTGVSRRIKAVSWIVPVVKVLLAISAVVTPLGLEQSVALSKKPEVTEFQYARDPSGFGIGAMPRSALGYNRFCGGYPFWACPGKAVNVSEAEYTDATPWIRNDISIPPEVNEVFTSGLKSLAPTVSGWFDIEWRSYEMQRDTTRIINNGSDYLVGGFRNYASLLLSDKVEAVEGLIVDSRSGGIGLRNHSIPTKANPLGITWTEDILFLEPETQCVDTNLTIDFPLPDHKDDRIKAVLTDRGGFVNIDSNFELKGPLGNDTQDTLDLRAQAYKGAWVNNVLSMQFLDVLNGSGPKAGARRINSALGQEFYLGSGDGVYESMAYKPAFDSVATTTFYGSYLPLRSDYDQPLNKTQYKNVFNVTKETFFDYDAICPNQGGADKANISNIAIVCGLVYGAGRPANNSEYYYNDGFTSPPGTYWTVPIFSCASAVKAVIKTVQFSYVGDGGLLGIEITNVSDKEYRRKEDMPRWITENTHNNLSYYDAMWGMAAPSYQDHANISAVQKEHLWLPGYSRNFLYDKNDGQQNAPASTFHLLAMSQSYALNPITERGFGYSGSDNFAIYRAWEKSSRNASGVAHMLDLIWTDIAANSVVGTKGWVSQREPANLQRRAEEAAQVPTYSYKKVVQFNYIYGIPAYISSFVAILLIAGTLTSGLRQKVGLGKLRKYINRTSLSVSVVALLCPESAGAGNKQWESLAAKQNISIGTQRPVLGSKPADALEGESGAVEASPMRYTSTQTGSTRA